MLIRNEQLLLPTTMVGNYPNPRWYDGHAFATYPKGEFVYDSISREAFEDAVGAIVADQEAAGIDIIADGKVYGGDSPYGQIAYHYFERMSGFRMSGPPIGLPIYSTLYSPTCIGEVSRTGPLHLANLRAVRKHTKKPVKVSYTGIQVLVACTTNEYYAETRDLAQAVAKAFNEDFKELEANGCDIIQLDEFVWPYGMGDWEVEAFNAAVEGVGCQIWTHTCWGNYSGTPGYFPDSNDREFGAWVLDRRPSDAAAPERARGIFPKALDANMDALNYEVGRTGSDDLKPLLDNNWQKDFVAGVIDVKSTITETADEVADRIRQVLEFVPAEKLGLTTDCGLINLPRMVGQGKLRALADGAAIVRREIGPQVVELPSDRAQARSSASAR
jgi:methionine synthase II (cobalamin-independent)